MTDRPEYVALATMEIELAPAGHITLLPFLPTQNGTTPGMPFRLVLTQQQARELAQDLLDAADESAAEAKQPRN